jgi:predicted ferric reductase
MTAAARVLGARSDRISLGVGRPEAWGLLIGNGLLIAGMWIRHGGLDRLGSPTVVLAGLGQLAALYGTALALLNLVLLARVPWLDRWFGMGGLIALHRWAGFACVWLLVGHGVLTVAGFALADGAGLVDEAWTLATTEPFVLMAVASLALFILVAITSVRLVRRRVLSYETWHGLHLYAYLALALGLLHQLAIGRDLADDPVARAYWVGLYVAAFGAIIAFRVGLPVYRTIRHGLRVGNLVVEAPGVVSVYLVGRNLETLPMRAGQFLVIRFLTEGWWRGHPYSVSAQPNSRWIRVTIKDLGDDSGRVAGIPIGTRVLFEGPYGNLTAERGSASRVLLIGGGIGIAPLRALAEELSGQQRKVTVVYRARRPDDVVFRDEFDILASRRGVRLHLLLGRRDARGAAGDPLGAAMLGRLVPDVAAHDVYVCGPDGLIDAVGRTLRRLGVPAGRIFSERFTT